MSRRAFQTLRRLLAAAVILSGCRRDARTPLVLYSPHGRDLLGMVERAYESKHPDVDVRWLDMGSQEVYDRVRSEKANPQADVWYGGPDTIFARGARDGLLEAYRPSWAAAIPPEARGPRDLYFGLYRTPAVIVYNAAVVPAAEAPRDWDDVLQPRWKGRVLIRYPLASGTMRAIFGMILARSVAETGSPERGFEWLRKLDGQTREYVMNASVLVEKIARQEGLVTVWDLPDVLLEMRRSKDLAYVFPASGTPVIDDAVGLVRGARHSSQARALIEWLGGPEAQLLAVENAYRLPARTDLLPDRLPQWARDVEEKMVPAKMDWDLIEREGQAWMARWDREVRGKGKN
ncbi:MAG TPA: extracellular solute-binding protein [Thermoanaerobaculia bacterium]|nr:extracellular solute-binding protein [Thermoanaerobaculia bacterium]